MKPTQNNIPSWNNHKIFFLYPDKYWTINVLVDIDMSSQELDTYLSFQVAKTSNDKVLFFYIKQKNSYLVFIAKRLYIDNLIKKYPKTIIAPLSIAYKSLFDDDCWAVFYISENMAFVVTNINKELKSNPLPLSFSHMDLDDKDIEKTIFEFIYDIMPHIDERGDIKNIYLDSKIDISLNMSEKNVYKDIKIQKLNTDNFNPRKLSFNFAKIKSFRLLVLSSLLLFTIGGFFSTKIYLQIANDKLIQDIGSQNYQLKSINNTAKDIKDIKHQINIIKKDNDKQIVPNSNFSDRLFKILSSQDIIIKTISIDTNDSYVK